MTGTVATGNGAPAVHLFHGEHGDQLGATGTGWVDDGEAITVAPCGLSGTTITKPERGVVVAGVVPAAGGA